MDFEGLPGVDPASCPSRLGTMLSGYGGEHRLLFFESAVDVFLESF